MALQSLNRNDDAIKEFDILLKEDPKDANVLFQLVRLHKSAALAQLKELSSVAPDSVLIDVLKAENYSDNEEYAKAIKQYEDILQKHPGYPGIHFAMGEIYYKTVKTDEAIRELRLALREDPNHPIASYDLADLLIRIQKVNEAVPLLKTSIAADPQFVMGYFQLGKCYIAQDKLEDALAVFLKALELDPNYKSTHYQLAQLYARLNQPGKSREHMEIFQRMYGQDRAADAKRRKKHLESVNTDPARGPTTPAN